MNNKIDINTWSPHGDLMTKDCGGTMKCTRRTTGTSIQEPGDLDHQPTLFRNRYKANSN
jgi:hypothetical protein